MRARFLAIFDQTDFEIVLSMFLAFTHHVFALLAVQTETRVLQRYPTFHGSWQAEKWHRDCDAEIPDPSLRPMFLPCLCHPNRSDNHFKDDSTIVDFKPKFQTF